MDQKILLEQRVMDDAEIQQLREIKDMRKTEADEYGEKLRKVKNDHFN